jgi:segregation and condensation protein A
VTSAGHPEQSATSAWEDPPRSKSNHDAPFLTVEGFEGPLDWLLEMARAEKIDLAKLPIAALIESFGEALEAALARLDGRAPDLSRFGDWLVMAAALTELRSRLLLSADAPEAKAALSEAEALRRQLVGRNEMRVAADWLERRPQLGRDFFVRGMPEIGGSSRTTGVADLLRACLTLLRVPEELASVYLPRPPLFWPVQQALAHGRRVLATSQAPCPWKALLPAVRADHPRRERMCREAVSSTFVASLEIASGGTITLQQALPWQAIEVRKGVTVDP